MHLLLQIFLTVLGTLLCYIPYCGIMIYIADHSQTDPFCPVCDQFYPI